MHFTFVSWMFSLSTNVLWCRKCILRLHRLSLIKNYLENLAQQTQQKIHSRHLSVKCKRTNWVECERICVAEIVCLCNFILWLRTWEFYSMCVVFFSSQIIKIEKQTLTLSALATIIVTRVIMSKIIPTHYRINVPMYYGYDWCVSAAQL